MNNSISLNQTKETILFPSLSKNGKLLYLALFSLGFYFVVVIFLTLSVKSGALGNEASQKPIFWILNISKYYALQLHLSMMAIATIIAFVLYYSISLSKVSDVNLFKAIKHDIVQGQLCRMTAISYMAAFIVFSILMIPVLEKTFQYKGSIYYLISIIISILAAVTLFLFTDLNSTNKTK